MKELTALNGLLVALKGISKRNGYLTDIGSAVTFGRAFYNDLNDLPVAVLAPADRDNVNNQLAPQRGVEYNLTQQVTVEVHQEVTLDDMTKVYQAWRDVTKACLLWESATPADAIRISYAGKTITFPDDANKIAVLQVRFDIQYIEDLTI